jgi:hypothetical protein
MSDYELNVTGEDGHIGGAVDIDNPTDGTATADPSDPENALIAADQSARARPRCQSKAFPRFDATVGAIGPRAACPRF